MFKSVAHVAPYTAVAPLPDNSKLVADNEGNIFRTKPKPVIRRLPSILGKRKIVDAFGVEIYDDKYRYGQSINDDFFVDHVGHNVY